MAQDTGYMQGNNDGYSSNLKALKLTTEHEQSKLKEEHKFNLDCKDKDHQHEKEILEKNLGLIGRFFGCTEHASKNITAVICLSLIVGASLVSLLVYCCKQDIAFIKSMWINISPIITLSLGYLFGKK